MTEFGSIFKDLITQHINELLKSDETATFLHNTKDIRASGNEIEEKIRDTISLFLPEKYLVKSGHIIDSKGNTSPQLNKDIYQPGSSGQVKLYNEMKEAIQE